MDTARYGIVGTGMMGIEHLCNLRLVEGARVTAIADPHAVALGPAAESSVAERCPVELRGVRPLKRTGPARTRRA